MAADVTSGFSHEARCFARQIALHCDPLTTARIHSPMYTLSAWTLSSLSSVHSHKRMYSRLGGFIKEVPSPGIGPHCVTYCRKASNPNATRGLGLHVQYDTSMQATNT